MKILLKKFYERFAFNAMGTQDYHKASYYFKKIVDAYPHARGVHYNYAVSLIGSKQYPLAEKHLLEELNISGERFEIFKILGELYFTNNNSRQALIFLRKALEHCADEKEASLIKDKISIASNPLKYSNIVKARSIFEKASSHLDNNEWRRAQILFKQALEFDTDNPLIYNNLGVISLNHEKAYAKARGYFQKALEYSDLPIIKRNLSRAEFYIQKAHEHNT